MPISMNSKLDAAKVLAQREADKTHRTMLVLNLNPFSPLYVVREWSQKARDSKEFVAEIEPSVYR
jgi:hypothetical protein